MENQNNSESQSAAMPCYPPKVGEKFNIFGAIVTVITADKDGVEYQMKPLGRGFINKHQYLNLRSNLG